MKRLIKWYKENSPYIVPVFVVISLVLTGFLVMFMEMGEDLVNRVKSQENEIIEVQQERNYYYTMYDSILQSHEDCIPKQQYIDDVEYLESVIRELRGQE